MRRNLRSRVINGTLIVGAAASLLPQLLPSYGWLAGWIVVLCAVVAVSAFLAKSDVAKSDAPSHHHLSSEPEQAHEVALAQLSTGPVEHGVARAAHLDVKGFTEVAYREAHELAHEVWLTHRLRQHRAMPFRYFGTSDVRQAMRANELRSYLRSLYQDASEQRLTIGFLALTLGPDYARVEMTLAEKGEPKGQVEQTQTEQPEPAEEEAVAAMPELANLRILH